MMEMGFGKGSVFFVCPRFWVGSLGNLPCWVRDQRLHVLLVSEELDGITCFLGGLMGAKCPFMQQL